MTSFIETPGEASRGGFKGIKKIKGTIVSIDLVDAPAEWEEAAQQIKVEMEDVVILEMFPGEEPFELKDGKYSFFMKYAEKGQTPRNNSSYIKCWAQSAYNMNKKPTDFIGKQVTLEKIKTLLFQKTDKITKAKEDVYTENCFSFVKSETFDSDEAKEYIRKLVKGLAKKAALHALILDPRAGQMPEFKEACQKDTLAELLGMDIVDEKFVLKES
jgi:hypothetical protein